MGRSLQELRDNLNRIHLLLPQEAFLFLSEEERKRLVDESTKLVQKLESVADSYLMVGLLGGTGVGKSSLLNALARAPIASASHRRPHTDQVLIYRHAGAPLPAGVDGHSFPWADLTHEVEGIRQIILCDLPDFDSLLAKHREQVLDFLEHLDILVWVVSLEKYADEKFYAFLRKVPKARRNFYFVLNKADQLFDHSQSERGYRELAAATAQFSRHLHNHGISQPVIYALSAREGAHGGAVSPWNQLWNFRNQVFYLRDTKELTAIKAANLDVEISRLGRVLEREVSALKTLHSVLEESVHSLENMRAEWRLVGEEAFSRALEKRVVEELFLKQPVPPRVLVGIGHALAVLLSDWRRFTTGAEAVSEVSDQLLSQQSLRQLQQELGRVRNRIIHQCLQRGLPPFDEAEAGGLFEGGGGEELSQRLREAVRQSLDTQGAMPTAGFRALQYASYLLLLALLILGMSGETAWRLLFEQPSWHGLLGWASTVIRTLFSPNGLAALGSYALLQVFLGFRFHGRYKKLLQRHAQKFIESLKLELGRVWEEERNILIARLGEYAQRIEGRSASLAALAEPGSED